jgi:hypothetical protein
MVLLDLVVFCTEKLRSGCGCATLLNLTDIRKIELGVDDTDMGFEEIQFAARDLGVSDERDAFLISDAAAQNLVAKAGIALFAEVLHPRCRKIPLRAHPSEPSQFPPAPTAPRPPFAYHIDEILLNFGYDRSEIAALREGKVI